MSWWLRKPQQVNYAEDSDEEEDLETGLVFDSPLTSPGRPHQSASVSPRVLLQPDQPDIEETLKVVHDKLINLPVRDDEEEVGAEHPLEQPPEGADDVTRRAGEDEVDEVDEV